MGDLEVFSFVRSAIYGVALMGVMAGTASAAAEAAETFQVPSGLVSP